MRCKLNLVFLCGVFILVQMVCWMLLHSKTGPFFCSWYTYSINTSTNIFFLHLEFIPASRNGMWDLSDSPSVVAHSVPCKLNWDVRGELYPKSLYLPLTATAVGALSRRVNMQCILPAPVLLAWNMLWPTCTITGLSSSLSISTIQVISGIHKLLTQEEMFAITVLSRIQTMPTASPMAVCLGLLQWAISLPISPVLSWGSGWGITCNYHQSPSALLWTLVVLHRSASVTYHAFEPRH